MCLPRIDQPLADPALIALNAIAEFAREDVTVAVGGEGADELFGGYPRYAWLDRARDARRTRAAGAAQSRRLAGSRPLARGRGLATRSTCVEPMSRRRAPPRLGGASGATHARQSLYGPALAGVDRTPSSAACDDATDARPGGSLPAAFMRMDQRFWLQDDVLPKADRAGMLVSLELRTPYLHRELAEFAATVPSEVHLAGGGKRLLRRVLRADRAESSAAAKAAPSACRWPTGCAARCDRCSRSTSDRIAASTSEGLFDREQVRLRSERHLGGVADESAVLWPLLTLGLWLDARRAT